MRKKILFLAIIVAAGLFYFIKQSNTKSDSEKLRESHAEFLENYPFKQFENLSRKERKSLGLPPNAYNEQLYKLTMDPSTGRPMPERINKIQEQLQKERKSLKAKGGAGDDTNPWVDRGPNNIGGRTRGIMFDPNDTTHKRVFAGGVNGGLWVNEDITTSGSSWTQVMGLPGNVSINVIISDPNNSNVFYIGSGESYTSGRGIGTGVWKSIDGGVNWTNIFGGGDGTISNNNQIINGIFYINDLVARNVDGQTELYAAVAGASYATASPSQFHGLSQQGVYKSIDAGNNWTKFNINEDNGTSVNPNDIEIDLNNNIWFTSTRSSFGIAGGKIFKSIDGENFTLETTIANANRTELETSNLDPNKLWVAANVSGQADLFITTDAFETITQINEPEDADNGISATDYTRRQAFYDLPIEADSSDRLYVGGIDLFVSIDSGNNWAQISKWSNNPGLNTLSVPLIHADHHAIVFRPENPTQVVFAHDGGISFSSDATKMGSESNAAEDRNTNYNVTQFYYGSMSNSETNEILYGGTQDNGTIISQNSVDGANSFNNYFAFTSGDGSYSEIDKNGGLEGFNDGEYMIVGSVYAQYYLSSPNVTSSNEAFNNGYDITEDNSDGDFINPAELDHESNILYANTSSGNDVKFSAFKLGAEEAVRTDYTNPTFLTSEPTAFKVSPFDNTTILIGTTEGKLIEIEKINIFKRYSDLSGEEFVGSISDVEYGLTDQDIFVTFHNYGVKSIFYTGDGGTTWKNIEGNFPDIPVKCILQNPLLPNELIIGTELGVWKTLDYTVAEPVWIQSDNGMRDATVLDLDLRGSDNKILASTHGRGMFTSFFTANTTSVEDVLTNKKEFTIYPTVSNGNFTLFGKNTLGKTRISIFNLNGKEVYKSSIDFSKNERNEISVNLSSGSYIINLVDRNNKRSSSKIVIK